jgi:hypothetical protein
MGVVELTNAGGKKIVLVSANKEVVLQKVVKQIEITASGKQGPPGPPGSFEAGNLDCGTF